MNSKLKRVFAGIVAAATVFACASVLGSCGDKDSEGVLKIGAIGPITGTAATYGTAVKNGAELAIKEINAAGGVNGMKLELDYQDDANTTNLALEAYNTIKDNGAKLLIGTVTSTPCQAVAVEAEKDNMFLLTPSGSAVECIKPKNAFRICFSDPDQGAASAKYISEKKLAQKVAVIYDSTTVYSTGLLSSFKSITDVNFEIVSEQTFTDGDTDFSTQVQAVKASGADLVFLPIYYEAASMILKEANAQGLDVKFFGCDGLDGVIGQLGKDSDMAEGVMLLTPFAADSADEKSQKFTAAYKAAYNDEVPNQFAADAYDAVYTVKAALEKADVKDASISASQLCDKLVEAMPQITVDGVTGKMTWNAAGEPTKDAKAMYIEGGSYKALN